MLKVAVVGSRGFRDYEFFENRLDFFLSQTDEQIEIVSGGARGTDKMAEEYARAKGYWLQVFPADWGQHGKKAGYLRNVEMANYATHFIVFWDFGSPGTRHMLRIIGERGKPFRLVRV